MPSGRTTPRLALSQAPEHVEGEEQKNFNPQVLRPIYLLTQNLHLAPNTQQAEQAGFTREEITRRASQFSLKIDKRQSS
jgi:hypothetical protein